MIEEKEINEIRQNADIVEIISSYMPLTQKGKNYFGVCPFHDDHHPSMVVSPEKQIFNCFTCKTGGNVFNFVMKYENVNYGEAIKIVADKIGMSLSINKFSYGNNKKYQQEFDMMKLVKNFYVNNLNTSLGLNAKKYLMNRGFNEEIISIFNIGFSLNDNHSLSQFLESNKIEINEMDKLGLINKSGIDIYDVFVNRIMIPLCDGDGNVVGFTGRIFNNEDSAKYLNTKETIIFKKSNLLFNYYLAKNEIRNCKKVIIVEGNMDAIKMYASGIKNVIALMGTALTREQIAMIKKFRCPVILMLDNDDAGYEATIKNGDLLSQNGMSVDVVRLNGAKDPDEYLEKLGVDALKEAINHPIKYLDFKINDAKRDLNLNSPEELSTFVKKIISFLKYYDNLTKEITINKICSDYHIDISILQKEMAKSPPIKEEEKPKTIIKKTKYDILANYILYYMMNDEIYLKIYKKELGYLEKHEDKALEDRIEAFYKEKIGHSLSDFISYCQNNEELINKVLEIINDCGDETLDEEKYYFYLSNMKKVINDQDVKELLEKIKQETDVNKKIKLMQKLTNLKKGSVENG